MQPEIKINFKSLFLIVLVIITGWLLYQIRDILSLLFISFIIMTALRPGVLKLQNMGLSKFLSIFVLYLIIILVLIGSGSILIPPLVSESVKFVNNFPYYLTSLSPYINFNTETIVGQIAPFGQNMIKVVLNLFSDVLVFFALAVFTFYLLLERENLHHFLKNFVGEVIGKKTLNIINQVEVRLGAWVRGQIILGLIIGMTTYLGLTFLGINYALPLALIAGMLELIPNIGPIISAIPAMLVAVTVSPGLALAVAVAYFLIQQAENHIIVPQVMQKAVGVPPLISIIAMMIGGKLGGVIGIILAIPLYLVIETVVKESIKKT